MRSEGPRKLVVGDMTLNVLLAGEGPPVLLLHGFPDSHALWREVVPRLARAGYSVIASDLRGFGESDAPAGRRNYTTDRTVADLRGLLAALDVREPVHVVGHDWGSAVAWYLSMVHPELVRSNVVVSLGHPTEYLLAGFEQRIKGYYTLFWQLPGIAEASLTRHDFAGLRHWLRDHPDADACVRELARPGRLTAGLNWYRANLAKTLSRWPACRVPTLGVWSARDHCLTEDQMVKSRRRVSAPWHYERIDDAAHWIPLERPERLTALALDWFARHGTGDRAGAPPAARNPG